MLLHTLYVDVAVKYANITLSGNSEVEWIVLTGGGPHGSNTQRNYSNHNLVKGEALIVPKTATGDFYLLLIIYISSIFSGARYRKSKSGILRQR